MLQKHDELLDKLESIGRPASISELREGFQVDARTVRRWLLELCAEGKIVATGINKGRRYQATVQEAGQAPPNETLESLQRDLAREAIRDGAHGRTLAILLTERVRAHLPASARRSFVDSTLKSIQSLTQPKAESLGISPEMFKYWRSLQRTHPSHAEKNQD